MSKGVKKQNTVPPISSTAPKNIQSSSSSFEHVTPVAPIRPKTPPSVRPKTPPSVIPVTPIRPKTPSISSSNTSTSSSSSSSTSTSKLFGKQTLKSKCTKTKKRTKKSLLKFYQKLQSPYDWASNSCYLHSLLQLLRNIPELLETLKTNVQAQDLYNELTRNGLPTSQTKKFIEQKCQLQSWGNQHDPRELLFKILELLFGLKNENMRSYLYLFFDLINFIDYTKKIVNNIVMPTNIYLLPLVLIQERFNNMNEIIQNNYPSLPAGDRKVVTDIHILDTTNYLLISPNVFDQDYNKIKLQIKDIEDNICIGGVSFEPISIVYHRGDEISSGHFINCSKQIDKNNKVQWFKFDDIATIKVVELGQKINNKIDTPYIFLYKRIQ